MTTRRPDGATLRRLRALYNLGAIGELTDGQLLERFATDRDEVAGLAFSALVERHQAMVWRACLAILGDRHQAEDAFQATFLVLVKKARTLWVRDSLAPWLHQVARRAATRLRASARRRRSRELRLAERAPARAAEASSPPPPRDHDVEAAIQEEVGRLPEKYRAPVVLCDLEGRTHAEAARALGWPIGTVKSRQSRGRRLIRDRLVGRGLGAAVASAVAGPPARAAVAAIPPGLARGAVAASMHLASRSLSGLAAPAPILTLAQGVIRTMFWNRLRSVAVAALAAGIASGGAGLYGRGSQDPAPNPDRLKTDRLATAPPAAPESRERLRAQNLATRKAKALAEIARLNREIAEIAVEEYREVGFARDQAAADGGLALAQSDLTRAEDRREWSRRMFKKGYVSEATKRADELTAERVRFDLEQARTQRTVLVGYTRDKTLKLLQIEVEKAIADEEAKRAAWVQEQVKERDLELSLGREQP